MTATLLTADGRPMLRFERRLTHPPAKVWRAITEPAHLAGWFPWRVDLDLRVGGAVRFAHPEGAVTAPDAVLTEVDPPRALAYTWDGAELRWELTAEGEGCLLVFTHAFAQRSAAAKFAAGWAGCLDALESTMDERAFVQPPGRWAERNAYYVEEFGLLDGELLAGPHGARLRFVQELVSPVGTVWAALGGGDATVGGPVPSAALPGAGAAGPVERADAPTVLAYRWDPAGRVRWELIAQDFGTQVVLTHDLPADQAGDLRTAWRERLRRLGDELRLP